MTVSCSLVVTCWEKTDLMALLYVMFCVFFFALPYSILGQVWYLIVSIPDVCLLPYFENLSPCRATKAQESLRKSKPSMLA